MPDDPKPDPPPDDADPLPSVIELVDRNGRPITTITDPRDIARIVRELKWAGKLPPPKQAD